MKPSWNFAKPDLGDRMNVCSQSVLWLHRTSSDLRLPSKATPVLYQLGRDCRTRMDVTSTSPDDEAMEELHSLTAD